MLNLDFTLDSQARVNLVNNFINTNPDYTFAPNELATITNYLLYGRDETGNSIFTQHYAIDPAKPNKRVQSLEGLMETMGGQDGPAFEPTLEPVFGRKPKAQPRHPRAKRADITGRNTAGLASLTEAINGLECKLTQGKQSQLAQSESESRLVGSSGDKSPSDGGTDGNWRTQRLLVELRQQQYALHEACHPTPFQGSTARAGITTEPEDNEWENIQFWPLGLYVGDTSRFRGIGPHTRCQWDRFEPNTNCPTIDFTNPHHIYLLADHYAELDAIGDRTSVGRAILDTLDFYASLAEMDASRRIVWEGKTHGRSNVDIQKELAGLGKGYSENYISTIFKQQICPEIARQAQLNFDEFRERDTAESWKVCSKCGRRLLADTRRFMRKTKSSDGLSSWCKRCEKERREQGKGNSGQLTENIGLLNKS